MKRLVRRPLPVVAVFGLLVCGTSPPASEMPPSKVHDHIDDGSRSVLTQHNDSARTGAYLVETQLTPAA